MNVFVVEVFSQACLWNLSSIIKFTIKNWQYIRSSIMKMIIMKITMKKAISVKLSLEII